MVLDAGLVAPISAQTHYATSPIPNQYKQRYLAKQQDARYQAQLAAGYADAFKEVEKDLDRLMARVAAGEEGLSFDLQERRMRTLLSQYQTAIKAYTSDVLSMVHSSRQGALQDALSSGKGLVGGSMGRAPTGVMAATYFDSNTWGKINTQAYNAVTSMFAETQAPLRALMAQLGDDTMRLVRTELQRGILLGRNPLKIASRIKAGTSNIALARARLIARTEFHRAYRMANREQWARSDVVKGWTWLAKLDGATCGICVAMAGTQHGPLDYLDGHPGCRCVMVPLTKTWAELGFAEPGQYWDVPEGALVQSGADWLRGLGGAESARTLKRLFGPTRYQSVLPRILAGEDLGAIMRSFLEQRQSAIWGPMKALRPLGLKTPPPPPVSTLSNRNTSTSPIAHDAFIREATATDAAWHAAGPDSTRKLNDLLKTDEYLRQIVDTDWASDLYTKAVGPAVGVKAWANLTEAERIAYLRGAGETQLLAAVNEISRIWQGTSADHNANALAFQKAVADEFGLAYGDHLTNNYVWKTIENEKVELYRVVARATYQLTQELLESRGIEYVYLARGQGYSAFPQFRYESVGYHENADFHLQPASSFSSSLSTADQFKDVTVTMRVHRTNVLSLAGHGFGTGYENEWLLLGGTYHGRVTKVSDYGA